MNDAPCIVVFRTDFRDQDEQIALLRRHGARIVQNLQIINAIAVEISAEAEKALMSAPQVLRLDTDEPIIEVL